MDFPEPNTDWHYHGCQHARDGWTESTSIIGKKTGNQIIALTMLGDFATVSRMMESGADGYILKNTDTEELFTAIEMIENGGTYLNPEINQVLLKGMKQQKELSPQLHLTKREKEILKLVVEGLSTKQIAAAMSLGEETIKSHARISCRNWINNSRTGKTGD